MRTPVSLAIAAALAGLVAAPALVAADETVVEHRSTYNSEKTEVEAVPAPAVRERTTVETVPAAPVIQKKTSETTVKSDDADDDDTKIETKTKTKVEHDD